MACLCSLQASNILNEVDRTKLFSNIPEIYAANRYFWTEYVLAMVNTSRTTGQPLEPGHLLQGFETFEQTFAPYTRYCAEQSKCQQYCRDRLNDNQLFTVYLVVRIFFKRKIKYFLFSFFHSFFLFSVVRDSEGLQLIETARHTGETYAEVDEVLSALEGCSQEHGERGATSRIDSHGKRDHKYPKHYCYLYFTNCYRSNLWTTSWRL